MKLIKLIINFLCFCCGKYTIFGIFLNSIFRNKRKIAEKIGTVKENEKGNVILTEKICEEKKGNSKGINILPEPSSEEGWTSVPETVKKMKQKKKKRGNQSEKILIYQYIDNGIKKLRNFKENGIKKLKGNQPKVIEEPKSLCKTKNVESQQIHLNPQKTECTQDKINGKKSKRNNQHRKNKKTARKIAKKIIFDIFNQVFEGISREKIECQDIHFLSENDGQKNILGDDEGSQSTDLNKNKKQNISEGISIQNPSKIMTDNISCSP